MSLVFGRISKRILCFGRDACVGRSIRLFSSSPSPYLLLPGDVTGSGKAVNFSVYDPRKGQIVKIPDQTLPPELHSAQRVGASRGWVALLNKRYLTLHLTNIFNPSASPSSHKVITLPSLGCLPCVKPHESPDNAPTDFLVDHVSLSSSPDEDDCVVGVWLQGRFLSFCRLGDSTWACNGDPVETPASSVMYSKRDRVFYFMAKTYDRVYVHDLNNPKFLPVRYNYRCARFLNIPDISHSETEMETLSEYIVETPTGELLLATRYVKSSDEDKEVVRADLEGHKLPCKTVRFRVYRFDIKQETRTYTEDLGDLSLFLGRNEGFCLPPSQYPGLKPNSIYFGDDEEDESYGGQDMGVYDIAEKTVTRISNSGRCKSVPQPFWLAPLA